MANPVLVEMTRGGHVESRHRGAFAAVRADGKLVASAGDVGRSVFARSAYKLLQALPLAESGAAAAFDVSPEELALACASHSGEPMHTERVEAWLKRLEMTDADLECGPHGSHHEPTRVSYVKSGTPLRNLNNNCSGKHAGYLTVAKHLGVSPKGYTRAGHPVQDAVTHAIGEMCDMAPDDFIQGTDGCAALNLAMPLTNLALGFARVADPAGLAPARVSAITGLRDAVRAYPLLMSGTGRACAAMINATEGKAVVKVGAEGVYTAAIPSLKLGIALKIDDGAVRGAEIAMTSLLVGLGLAPADHDDLAPFYNPQLKNTRDMVVGEGRGTDVLKIKLEGIS